MRNEKNRIKNKRMEGEVGGKHQWVNSTGKTRM